MRSLTLNEMQTVNGAGYAEDIVATAATIYTGTVLSGFGIGVDRQLVVEIGLMNVGTTIAPILTAVIGMTAPFILPAFVACSVLSANPDFVPALESKFHQYFG